MTALLSAVWFVLQIGLVVAIPWAVMKVTRLALERVAPGGFYEVPAVVGVARLLGILLGGLLLSSRAESFNVRLLFGPESPWNLTTWQFLAVASDPLWTVNGLIGQIEQHGFGFMRGTLTILIVLLSLSVLLTPLAFWRGSLPLSGRAVVAGLCVALVTAYVTIYGVSLFFWLLFLLNFWMLGLLFVMLQWYRHRA
jgi:hypothetical protein